MKPLKPVMAAILAASSAAFALPGTSHAITPQGVAAPTSAPVKTPAACPAGEKNPVNALTCLIAQKPEVRAAIGARLAEFVQSKDSGGKALYLTSGLQSDKVNLPGVVAVAQKWPEANKAKPGTVAVLYFVVGPGGDAPAWAQSTVLAKTLKPDMKWSARLADALLYRHWTDTKRIPQSGAAEATTAFLNDAAEQAQKVLDDPRTKKDIQLSIGDNDVTGVTPPTTAQPSGPSNAINAAGSGFSYDDLYVKGAEVANIYGPKDHGYRTLSMKVYTTKDSNGLPINQIGIVDITPGDITSPSLPRFIDVSRPGDSDIVMHDGGRHYTVTVGADGSVTLKRAGAKAGDGGGSKTTSIKQLSSDRDDQIRNGGKVMIGGQPYYVLGQGGQKGSFLFFSKAQLDASKANMDAFPNGNAHPALMGDVAQVAGDNTSAPITGKPDLGTLQNGAPYHLEFDMASQMWKVVPGEGDKPKAAAPAAGPAAGAAKPANSAPADQTPAAATPAAPPATLEEAINQAEADQSDKTKVWVEDDGNAGLDPDVRARLRIMSNQRSDGTHFKVLFDPSLGVKDNAFEFKAESDGVKLLHIRGVKKFIAMEYATGTQYYDLPDFANYVEHVYDASLTYSLAGSYAVSNGQMQDVTSLDIVDDVLTHYLKVKAGDPMLKTVGDRIAAHAKGAGFVVNGDGSKAPLVIGVGEKSWTIWPDDIASGDKGTNEKMTGLRGPGTGVDLTGGEPGDFNKEMDMPLGRKAILVKTENHAAIYVYPDDENVGGKISTVKTWGVMIEYKKNGLASRSKALPVFGGHDRYPMPAGIQMQGLPDVDLPDTTQLMMLYGSNQENGAIAAYRYAMPDAQGGSNVKDKKGNCGGPVLWWGSVTKERAQAACEGDSKLK